MSLKYYQKQVDDLVQPLEKPYFGPLSGFARLVEEVGEMGRCLNHKYGDKVKKTTEAPDDLEGEIGDVLFCLICAANRENIDLDKAMKKVLRKFSTRDADRFAKK